MYDINLSTAWMRMERSIRSLFASAANAVTLVRSCKCSTVGSKLTDFVAATIYPILLIKAVSQP